MTVLKRAEVNIDKNGNLDMREKVPARLDVAGCAVDEIQKMSRRDPPVTAADPHLFTRVV